jgi:hypothetical protein
MLEEELDAAQSDGEGTGRNLYDGLLYRKYSQKEGDGELSEESYRRGLAGGYLREALSSTLFLCKR